MTERCGEPLALRDDPREGVRLLTLEVPFAKLCKAERLAIKAALRAHRKRRRWRKGEPPLGSKRLEAWIEAEFPDKERHKAEITEIRKLWARARFIKDCAELLAKRRKREDLRSQIIKLYFEEHRTVSEIAAALGISASIVYRDVARHRRANGLAKEHLRSTSNDEVLPEAPAKVPATAILNVSAEQIVELARQL